MVFLLVPALFLVLWPISYWLHKRTPQQRALDDIARELRRANDRRP